MPSRAGYIGVWRKVQDNPLHFTQERRSPTRYEAREDLWMMMAYEERQVVSRGESITLLPGQVLCSISFLATRWRMTRPKVRRLLKLLVNLGEIEQKTSEKRTVLTFCHHEEYRVGRTLHRPPDRPADVHVQELRINQEKGIISPPPPIPRNRAEASDDRRDRALALVGKCQGHAVRLRGSKLIDFDAPPQMSHLQTLRTDVEIEETFEFFLKSRRKADTATFRNFFRFFEEIENELVEAEITEGRSNGKQGDQATDSGKPGSNGNGTH